MKKICKITTILLIIINIYMLSYGVYAKNIWDTGKNFLDDGSEGGGWSTVNKIFSWASKDSGDAFMISSFQELIDFTWGIGLLVVLVSGVVLGIKYMLVLPNEKSRLKQATTPYIIGVVIIFGALTIWKFVIMVLDGSL